MSLTVWCSVFIQRLRVNSYNTHHTWTHDVCIRTHRQWFKAQGIMGGVTLYPGGLSVCSCVITPHSVCQVLCGDTFSLLDRCWASVSSLDHSTSSPVLHILHSLLSFAHFLSFSSLLPAFLPPLFFFIHFSFVFFSSPLLFSLFLSSSSVFTSPHSFFFRAVQSVTGNVGRVKRKRETCNKGFSGIHHFSSRAKGSIVSSTVCCLQCQVLSYKL